MKYKIEENKIVIINEGQIDEISRFKWNDGEIVIYIKSDSDWKSDLVVKYETKKDGTSYLLWKEFHVDTNSYHMKPKSDWPKEDVNAHIKEKRRIFNIIKKFSVDFERKMKSADELLSGIKNLEDNFDKYK